MQAAIAEFWGTLILVLLGNGVVAGVLLKQSKANNAGWIVITAGWALAVLAGVLVAQGLGSPGAHLNPAVTLYAALKSNDFSNLVPFWGAQMLGALAGATLVWLHYFPHWQATEETDLKLACFSCAPAIRAPLWNLLSEIIGTAVLLWVTTAMGSKGVGGLSPGMAPPIVGAVVWSIGLSLGGPTGYAINPARDLGPRIAHALLPISGKGDSDWSYAAIPVLGPLLAAPLVAFLLPAFPG